MKYTWIDAQKRACPPAELCAVLAVSVSDDCSWKRSGTPNRQRLTFSQLLARSRAIHAELKGAYGNLRIRVCANFALRAGQFLEHWISAQEAENLAA
ncbi:MAG: hypothetical protein HWD57_11855 [Candidatus Accumulibacter cognatus]|uniref:Uncharacterized protein n=1 Tax=Candidatus Accumulibacter cognatus TaxID=2954383 RepID=A0A7D5SAJ9_9PROT|nr:MAG: hypothetical protein HWD57_11855 [Candidatus Accumulibacter cognatus]